MSFENKYPYLYECNVNGNLITVNFKDCFWLFDDSCTTCHRVYEIDINPESKEIYNDYNFQGDLINIINDCLKAANLDGILIKVDYEEGLIECKKHFYDNLCLSLTEYDEFKNNLNKPASHIQTRLILKRNLSNHNVILNEFMNQCFYCPNPPPRSNNLNKC